MKPSLRPDLRPLKTALFLACLIPLSRLLVGSFTGGLGADPVAAITGSTGRWALNLLLVTLAFTPLRKLTGWQWLARLRRTVALFAFFYACLHFAAYLVFDQFFDWAGMVADIGKRPFIAAGFLCFALMVPLALTSTDGMMRRLGGRHWLRLHRLAYLGAAAAILHYLWLVKRDITMPGAYALALCALLCARLVQSRRKSKPGTVDAKRRQPPENQRPCA